MFGVIPVTFANLLVAAVVSVGLIILGLYLFQRIWLKNYDFQFPRGHYTNEGNDDETEFLKASTLSTYFRIAKMILDDLDHEYWIKYTGYDGYSYMLFQRSLIHLFSTFFFINLVFYFGMFLFLIFKEGEYSIVLKLLNTDKYEWIPSFYSNVNLTLMTFLVIYSIVQLRRQLQAAFYYNNINNDIDRGLNYLKLRTVELENESSLDLDTTDVEAFINKQISKLGFNTKINASVVVPDFSDIFDLEIQRGELTTGFKLVSEKKPMFGFLVPSELKNTMAYHKKMDELNYKIDQACTKSLRGSKTVFMSINSLMAISMLRRKFKRTAAGVVIGMAKDIGQVGNILQNTMKFMATEPDKIRDDEALLHENDTYAATEEREPVHLLHTASSVERTKKFRFKLRTFPHPVDINWRLVNAEEHESVFKSFLLTTASILVLIFLTTPAALIQAFSGKGSGGGFLSLRWADNLPLGLGVIAKALIPSLVVILANQVLLFLIELLVGWEKLNRYSIYQEHLLQRGYVYFLFNMLIVPGFAAIAFSNLFEIFNVGFMDYKSFFKQLFVLKNGDFFLALILQQAGGVFMTSLSSLVDLFVNYLSPHYTLYTRLLLLNAEAWRKNDATVFTYGMNYALMLVIAAIGITFAGTILFLPLAIIFYIVVRHIADGHQLLIWHKQEIESTGTLVHSSMDRLVFSLLIAQGSSVFKQIFSGSLWSSAYTIFLLFFTTIFMYILASRPLITPEKFPDDDEVFTDHMIEQWYNQYRHPLVVRTAKDEKKSPFVNAFFDNYDPSESLMKQASQNESPDKKQTMGVWHHRESSVLLDGGHQTLGQSKIGSPAKTSVGVEMKSSTVQPTKEKEKVLDLMAKRFASLGKKSSSTLEK